MMLDAITFYNQQLKQHKLASIRLHKQLKVLSVLRLFVFLIAAFLSYVFFPNGTLMTATIALAGVLFLFLVTLYTNRKHQYKLEKRLIQINEEELKIASGDYLHRPDGMVYQKAQHNYSLDIDLFGKGSFFQVLNRTGLKAGTAQLSQLVLSNDTNDIKLKQEAVQELSQKPQWRQRYLALAQGIHTEHSANAIKHWLLSYTPSLNRLTYKFSIGFSIASLLVIALTIFQFIPINYAVFWLLIGLGITGYFVKRVNALAQHTSLAKDTIKQYALLLEQIEQETFKAQLLRRQQDNITSAKLKASEIFTKFSKNLDALDNRNNLISAVFGNGFFLWDIRQSYKIEQWILAYNETVEEWFGVVAFFDAYNSLGNYAFNHSSFVYPAITDGASVIEAQQLGHPLINSEKRVSSDVTLLKSQFFIVTGANMAGKSTFLRTVALHIVMANVGLPVCAAASTYKPIKLITSMRTSDSLTDDSSYFFSELKRLKHIVEALDKDNDTFVILDEILKGTNSTDKAIGSRKFVEKLVGQKATGIIATHDLSLTAIEKDLSAVNNYFFDAQIVKGQLEFNYKLQPGVCQNMNASFLLKKMNIV